VARAEAEVLKLLHHALHCTAPLFSHCEGKGIFHMVGCHICVQDVEIGSLGDVVLFIH
jgi:hypothetical protein